MKKILVTAGIVVCLYLALTQGPALIVIAGPYDGTKAEVERMLEVRAYRLSQWSPLTGLWFADWSK